MPRRAAQSSGVAPYLAAERGDSSFRSRPAVKCQMGCEEAKAEFFWQHKRDVLRLAHVMCNGIG